MNSMHPDDFLESGSRLQFSAPSWSAVGGLTKWVGKNAASGIVGSAAGMLFQEFLSAVGLGGPDLVGKLDEISNKLSEVQRSLERLTSMTAEVLQQFGELRIFMEKSMKVDALLTAMARIDVAYGRKGDKLMSPNLGGSAISLRMLTETMPRLDGATPEYLQGAAKEFASYVSDVPTCIDTIRRMLVEGSFGQVSLLQHWVRELVQQILAKKISRESAYLVLEGYFLQAVSVQMQGLCVHGVALSTDKLATQLIKDYLEQDFGTLMREQISAYLAAVDDLIFSTLDPIMLTGFKEMDEREFPRHVDEILLRADLLCAVLSLIGKKPDGVLASSPQAAIQGIYARSLFRPSDLANEKAPVMNLNGYKPAPAASQYQLPFKCLDLYAPGGKPTLRDVDKAKVSMARYRWSFPASMPPVGEAIDTRFRGSATPAMYPVFGPDEPKVQAAGIFNGSPLFRGLPSDVPSNASTKLFPSGNPHITYFNQKSTCSRHALTNDPGVSIKSSFEVHHAWRARTHETSHLVHRLFSYSGGRVRLRLSAHVTTSLSIGPRLDGDKFFYFHHSQIFHVLKLRFPDGSEKDVYNSSTAFDGEVDLNGGIFQPGHHTKFSRADKRKGKFKIEFDLVPGEYQLVLYNTTKIDLGFPDYEGWNTTNLSFDLGLVTLEMIF